MGGTVGNNTPSFLILFSLSFNYNKDLKLTKHLDNTYI